MCGRARCTLRVDDVPRACHLNPHRPLRSVDTHRYRPAYNVSPGSSLPVIRRDTGTNSQGVAIHCMKWGLIPSFTNKTEKPDHYKMFNARSESVTEKASFRRLVPGSRCLVAVEGTCFIDFTEWKKDGAKKQPYYIHFKDGRPMVFAALYDSWKNAEGEVIYTFTILTTSSSSALAWLHDRMPVILGNTGSTEEWLDGSSSSKFSTVLKPYEEPDLIWYPVTSAMNKPAYDGPECIREIQLKTEEMKPISSFFSKKVCNSDESKPVVTNACRASMHATPALTSKVEPDTEGNMVNQGDQQPLVYGSNEDVKLNVAQAQLANQGAHQFQLKRDYEQCSY
ncbi:uncharacterized protein LOC141670781 [Apium graveolens]|uniref:uncharacterized protein LOC141670781 n=1 Tax=Apium graveolens TaxID=4045 RepID=UPI003D7A81AE